MSTFHGLEMAKQALFTQQSALYTTGHNIANANTEGYSRQRVNFETTTPYPAVGRNRPQIPGQMGTGVEAGSIQRIRNEFLDTQFRGENTLSSYWQTRADALGRMEALMNEPSNSGLNASMDQFWQSLQDLAVSPTNSGARSVVVQRGQALADTFNHFSNTLTKIRGDLKQQIDSNVGDVNSILKQINDINIEVRKLETNGYVTNDLYDKRDVLIDRLSGIIDIEVSKDSSSPSADPVADGIVSITAGGKTILDGENDDYAVFAIQYVDDKVDTISISLGTETFNYSNESGTLNSLVHAYNDDYPEMLAELKNMAESFVNAFNEQHAKGNNNTGGDFFGFDTNGKMIVIQTIIDNPGLIAYSTDLTAGNGDNALNLAKVFDSPLAGLDDVSVKDFYKSIIGKLGVKAEQANRMADNTGVLLAQVQNQRESVSSVSLDEEMSNLVKFQHAYNAAARSLTAYDELIDRVINNMGLVGR